MPITSPDFEPTKLGIIGTVSISETGEKRAIVTSGDYQNRFVEGGRLYHHLLDPATGYPARGLCAVTVIAPTCTEADALSTTAFILGWEKGFVLLESLPKVEGLFIRETHNGLETRTTSDFPKVTPLSQ